MSNTDTPDTTSQGIAAREGPATATALTPPTDLELTPPQPVQPVAPESATALPNWSRTCTVTAGLMAVPAWVVVGCWT